MKQAANTQPVLTGDRVVLRPWVAGDAAFVFASCQDLDIQRWTRVPVPYHPYHAEQFVGVAASAAWLGGGGALFAVTERTDERLVGSIGVVEFRGQTAEVGYWAAPSGRGRGLMSAGVRLLAQWCLDAGRATSVELLIDPGNAPSLRVAQQAGFDLVRGGSRVVERRGDAVDHAVYEFVG